MFVIHRHLFTGLYFTIGLGIDTKQNVIQSIMDLIDSMLILSKCIQSHYAGKYHAECYIFSNAECLYSDCLYAECRGTKGKPLYKILTRGQCYKTFLSVIYGFS